MTKTMTLSFGVALGALFIATPAFADALPPSGEDCAMNGGTVAIGGACSLHDTANTAGTCQLTSCSHTPNPTSCDAGGADGGCGPVDSPCVLCIAGSAGGGDGGAATGDGGAATGDGGTTGKTSSGGCAVTGNDGSPWNILLPLGLAALVPLALRRKKNKA